MNKILLKTESLIIFLLCVSFYSYFGFSWTVFLLLFLVPDIGMIGYLKNAQVGSWVYNLVHTYVLSLLTMAYGFFYHQDTFLFIGLIWTSHIAFDRFLGYGLKYPTFFKDTHLGRL
jgi:hypothetical protein